MTKVLVVGSSGATCKLVLSELLGRNIGVVSIVRAASSLIYTIGSHPHYQEVLVNVSEMSDKEIASRLEGFDLSVSCLEHHWTLKCPM